MNLIVMGGGIAGLTAAVRATQLGKRVVVLEKGLDTAYPCNSRFTGGAMHICYRDPTSDPAILRAAIENATVGTARPDLADAMAANAGRVLDFLRSQGAHFIKGGAEEYKRWVLTPMRPQSRGLYWRGRSGDVMLRSLERTLTQGGGVLHRGARVTRAERRDDGWFVQTEGGKEFTAENLIIADGGFQANNSILRQHISPRPESILQRGARTGMGDGLQLAIGLGARTIGMNRFYGHIMLADALQRDDLWPYPWLDPVASSGIVVDSQGNRFVDEGKGGIHIANVVARLEDPLSTWTIFDSAIWQGPGARGMVPPNPNFNLAGINLPQADTLEALAAQIGLDAGKLVNTVQTYNAALAAGRTEQLTPPRKSAGAMPIAQAPFRAARLVPGITYTMGGIEIDGNARVIHQDGTVIEGLYAAGTAAGGLEGGPDGGYVGGLMKSVMTGLKAAEHMASRTT